MGKWFNLWSDASEDSYLLKVFPLKHSEWFQHAWAKEFERIYKQHNELREDVMCCFVMNCTLLKDGRFAFLMQRYWGNLRKAINVQILKDKTHLRTPFPPFISTNIIYQIARGMETLHCKGILHRDLKAANVFVRPDIEKCMRQFEKVEGFLLCHVADYESAEGVMETWFWRAPEVLVILRSSTKNKYSNPTIWTKKVDVYAYAMTCYEVLSGCIPFQSRVANDYNIGDERPPLPDYVDLEIHELLRKCWNSEPLERPTFEIICDELERFNGKKIKCCKTLAKNERDDDAKQWLMWPFNYTEESGGLMEGFLGFIGRNSGITSLPIVHRDSTRHLGPSGQVSGNSPDKLFIHAGTTGQSYSLFLHDTEHYIRDCYSFSENETSLKIKKV